jgi:hypothetical protein
MDDHGLERLGVFTKQQRDLIGTQDVIRFLSCKALTRGGLAAAADLFVQRWPSSPYAKAIIQQKAAVAPGDTLDPAWAGALITAPPVEPVTAAVQKAAVPDRAGFRKVPFGTAVPVETTGGTFAWTGSNLPKPITAMAYSAITLKIGKIAGIVVVSDELMKLSAPHSETTIAASLVGGLVAFQDQQLLDPLITEIPNVRPASITAGVTPTVTAGDAVARVGAVLGALFAGRPGTAKPVLILPPATAAALGAQLRVDAGAVYYGNVLVVAAAGAGGNIVAADAAAVLVADDGLALDVSEHATVELNDAPAPPGAATVLRSLWQANLVGVRAERFLWWEAAPDAVQVGAAA